MPLPLTFSECAIIDGHLDIRVQRNEAQAMEAVLYIAPGLAPLMQSNGESTMHASRFRVTELTSKLPSLERRLRD